MPLAILEIKMPKSCRTCDLVYFMGGDLMCISTDSTVGDFSKNRAPFCPLNPLPQVRPLEEFLNEVAEKIDAKLEAGRIDTPAISLRDYFAGQYLSGIIAKHGDQIGQFVAARDAYLIADEMLKARGGDEND